MKVLLKIALMIALSYLGQLIFPWWIIAVVTLIIAMIIKSKPFTDFLIGFLSLAILWGVIAWYLDFNTNSILTVKMAALFSVENSSIMILVTGLIGGLVGGFGALTGNLLRNILNERI